MAARYSGPECQELRRYWANAIVNSPVMSETERIAPDGLPESRVSLILDPENAIAVNNAAWELVSDPHDPWFDPKEGLARARKATELNSKDWKCWNTLGVAAFRACDWTTAQAL